MPALIINSLLDFVCIMDVLCFLQYKYQQFSVFVCMCACFAVKRKRERQLTTFCVCKYLLCLSVCMFLCYRERERESYQLLCVCVLVWSVNAKIYSYGVWSTPFTFCFLHVLCVYNNVHCIIKRLPDKACITCWAKKNASSNWAETKYASSHY